MGGGTRRIMLAILEASMLNTKLLGQGLDALPQLGH